MQTRITNVSGVSMFFGWIPPHGVTLANNAEVTLDGDLFTVLASGRNRYTRKNELTAMKASRDADHVHINVTDSEGSSVSA